MDPSYLAGGPQVAAESAGLAVTADGSQPYVYGNSPIQNLQEAFIVLHL